MAVISFLRSTVLSKIVMATTGVILLLFIIGHLVGNMQIFIGPDALNLYAQFLKSIGEVLWIVRIVLIVSLILHIITSLYLSAVNNAAKPVKYQVVNYAKAKLNSRSMLVTGIMIFAFVTYHLLHFTFGITNPDHYESRELTVKKALIAPADLTAEQIKQMPNDCFVEQNILTERHDVYKMVVLGFRNPFISVAYIIAVALLGVHLSHAIKSCFHTLGITGPKFTPWMERCSVIFSTIIALLYISIPVSVLLGLVGGSV